MNTKEIVGRCSTAAEEFEHHEHASDGLQVIESLCGGPDADSGLAIRARACRCGSRMGLDSMIQPLSEERSERTAKLEIEIYQVVVAADTGHARGYVADGNWFRDWLARLRLGNFDSSSRTARRIDYYLSKSAKDQRLAFSNFLDTPCPRRVGLP